LAYRPSRRAAQLPGTPSPQALTTPCVPGKLFAHALLDRDPRGSAAPAGFQCGRRSDSGLPYCAARAARSRPCRRRAPAQRRRDQRQCGGVRAGPSSVRLPLFGFARMRSPPRRRRARRCARRRIRVRGPSQWIVCGLSDVALHSRPSEFLHLRIAPTSGRRYNRGTQHLTAVTGRSDLPGFRPGD